MVYDGTNSYVKTVNSKRFGNHSNMGHSSGTYPTFTKFWIDGDEQKTEHLIFHSKRNGWEVRINTNIKGVFLRLHISTVCHNIMVLAHFFR